MLPLHGMWGQVPLFPPSQPQFQGKKHYRLPGTRQRSSPGPADGLGWATRHGCAVTGLGACRGQRAGEKWLPTGSQLLLPGRGPEAAGTVLGRGAKV